MHIDLAVIIAFLCFVKYDLLALMLQYVTKCTMLRLYVNMGDVRKTASFPGITYISVKISRCC